MATTTVDKGHARPTPWLSQLVTIEDPFNVHKTLGVLCLTSYCFRWTHFGRDDDMAFRTHPSWTLPTLLLHLFLSLSAFQFKIPIKRIVSGSRIWPEYRFHSLIFLSRALAVVLLLWYEQVNSLPPNYVWNLLIVLLANAAGDLASWSVGKYHSKSIRDLDVPPAIKFFFSLMQFKATTLTLYGIRRYGTFFHLALTIQVTAFIMTLVRKHLLSHQGSVVAYSLLLVWNIVPGIYDYTQCGWKTFLTAESLCHLAVMLRLRPAIKNPVLSTMLPTNKYVIWCVIFTIMMWVRPSDKDELPIGWTTSHLVLSTVAVHAAFVIFGRHKIMHGYGEGTSGHHE